MSAALLSSELQPALSLRLGIVREVHESTVMAGLPALVNVAASAARTQPTAGADINTRAGSCHFTRAQAWCAAVGETIERYCAAFVPTDSVVVGNESEIGPDAVDTDLLTLYRKEAEPSDRYQNPGPHTILGWSRGTRLADGIARLLPAQLVYLGYHLGAGEPRLGLFTSSGLCCERSLEAAVLGALLEQVERDAIMLAWRLRMSLPKFDWERDPAFGRIAGLMHGVRPQLTLLDASGFLEVPVVLAVLRDPDAPFPVGFVVGASAGLTPTDAAEGAFREVFQTLLMASLIARNAGADGAAASFDDHVARYIPLDMARRADFLTASSSVASSTDVPSFAGRAGALDAMRSLSEHLSARGVEPIAFNLTTSDIARLGLHVARVVCPQLVWLDVDFDWPFDGRPRIDQVARQLACPIGDDGHALLNPDPHPYP